MDERTKDISLKVFFRSFQALGVAVLLTIPAILTYKLMHGASWLACLVLFVAYLGSFVATMFLMIRAKRFDPVWCSLFGIGFFVLLFVSLRL